jgi:hypothetical protein
MCARARRNDDSDTFVVVGYLLNDDGLLTRDDFGCVQFEARNPD